MGRKKKIKRKRIRFDRIFIVLGFFIGIICLIRFSIYTILNFKVYNSLKKGNVIRVYNDELNIWKKSIKYIKDNYEEVTIDRGSYSFTISSSKIKRDMNIELNLYKKKIKNDKINNVKSFYIENNNITKQATSFNIKLPRFLYKRGFVDLYGINNDKYNIIESNIIVDNKYVKILNNKKFDDFLITYIELDKINSKNQIDVKVGDTEVIKLQFEPSNATDKNIKYSIRDKKIASINKGVIKGLKEGKTSLSITNSKNETSTVIYIVVKKQDKKDTKKEETKEEKTKQAVAIKKDAKKEVKNGITYFDGIMIVNKTYSLPSTYDPGSLTEEFMDAFYEMQSAALLDGISLFIASGYRSYEYQVDLYNYYVETDGKKLADTYSARPGHSEHQTGLTADINTADESFEGTDEAIWLDKNCYKYGFIVRYPKGKDEYTGYEYEPWHLRYVGKELAKKIHDLGGISLEEYFGITSKYEE